MPRTEATSTLRSLQGKKATASRWNLPDREAIDRDYAAAKLEDYIKRTVDAAPPLTAEQCQRLAALLRPTTSSGDAA